MNMDPSTTDLAAQRVFDIMRSRVTDEDLQRIMQAYIVACDALKYQRRRGGSSCVFHSVAVAAIVAEELELDANTVCAAFLHELEDNTNYTLDDIREYFGEDVTFLVDAVNERKVKRIVSSGHSDKFQQIVSSVDYDVRALLLILSNILQEMRTPDGMFHGKQKEISEEIDSFYAPLAGRLGFISVKSELENLSFRFRYPREYDIIAESLAEYKDRSDKALADFCGGIYNILNQNGVHVRIEMQYCNPYSIWRDMEDTACDFQQVKFHHYVNVTYLPMPVSPDMKACETDTAVRICSVLSDHFTAREGSAANGIDHLKDNACQSICVSLLSPDNEWEEVRITSERMLRNLQLGCMVERGDNWVERFRSVLRSYTE